MMGELISVIEQFKSIGNKPTRVSIVLLIITSFLLLSPDPWLIKFKLKAITDAYGTYLGITLIFSVTYVFYELIVNTFNKINLHLIRRKSKKSRISVVNQLDPLECTILKIYYHFKRNTIELPISRSVVSGLIEKKILVINCDTKTYGNLGTTANCSISEEFRCLINKEYIAIFKCNDYSLQFKKSLSSKIPWFVDFEQELI